MGGKKFVIGGLVISFLATNLLFSQKKVTKPKEEKNMLESIHWLGHASIKITGSKTIYVDPFQISGGEPADLILITHDHYDHCSPDDIKKIQAKHTVLVAPSSAAKQLSGNVKTIKPGESITVEGIEIQAVPAYNLKAPFHPKEKGYVGYIFRLDGTSYYHPGDTDFIPEMKNIHVDVAFLPIGGKYTMNAEEASKAAEAIQPKLAIPIHWGSIVGSQKDAEKFRDLCQCKVEILQAE
jgi:L-ascorbate metabolism protein UlaG (beta-lactamase superfamily)